VGGFRDKAGPAAADPRQPPRMPEPAALGAVNGGLGAGPL